MAHKAIRRTNPRVKAARALDLDLETCSWCTVEVPDRTLTDTDSGRICRECRAEARRQPS